MYCRNECQSVKKIVNELDIINLHSDWVCQQSHIDMVCERGMGRERDRQFLVETQKGSTWGIILYTHY